MDYLDGGDYVRRIFNMHVSGLHSMSLLDALFRSLQAVVLVFFVLMDASLLVFSPCITVMNQSCHGGDLRRQIFTVQVSLN